MKKLKDNLVSFDTRGIDIKIKSEVTSADMNAIVEFIENFKKEFNCNDTYIYSQFTFAQDLYDNKIYMIRN